MSILNISKLTSLLFENPIYKNEKARFFFIALGAGLVLQKTFSTAKCVLNSLFACQKDLAERYGKGSWVVITGASEGIGKAFCNQFARLGFNILLIARNQEKTEQVAREIKAQYPLIETKIVIEDFGLSWEEGFGTKILDAVEHLDVSVVINNVGQIYIDNYHEIPIPQVRDQLIVNCMSQAVITRLLLPKLVERKTRSAIINMSSLGSQYPRPFFQLYSATKAFNDFLSRAISEEYPNIDILSLKPGFVSTKMTSNKNVDIQTITTDDFVKNSLKYLGNATTTFGHWKHKYNAFQIAMMPQWFRTKYQTRRFRRFKESFKA